MRMGTALLIGGLAAGTSQAQAARTTCDGAEHRQFDFWIGTWTVRTANGQAAGTNRIEPILGGCALQETWTANGPSRGRSLSSYDRGTGKWHQAWVDNAGIVLLLSGGLVNGEMVLEGERTLADGTVQLERITWTPNRDGTLRQLWQASRSQGMHWSVVFDGTYRKAG